MLLSGRSLPTRSFEVSNDGCFLGLFSARHNLWSYCMRAWPQNGADSTLQRPLCRLHVPLFLTRTSLAAMGICLLGVAWCGTCGEVVANIVQDRVAVCTVLETVHQRTKRIEM